MTNEPGPPEHAREQIENALGDLQEAVGATGSSVNRSSNGRVNLWVVDEAPDHDAAVERLEEMREDVNTDAVDNIEETISESDDTYRIQLRARLPQKDDDTDE